VEPAVAQGDDISALGGGEEVGCAEGHGSVELVRVDAVRAQQGFGPLADRAADAEPGEQVRDREVGAVVADGVVGAAYDPRDGGGAADG
jgi:hypothetical protein